MIDIKSLRYYKDNAHASPVGVGGWQRCKVILVVSLAMAIPLGLSVAYLVSLLPSCGLAVVNELTFLLFRL